MSGQPRDIREGFTEAFDAEIIRRGLTNEEMARLLNTSERQVRRWRSGETWPNLRSYRRIRDLLWPVRADGEAAA